MGWSAAAAVGSALLGKSQSKKSQNAADNAMRMQGATAQQAMAPWEQYYGYTGGEPTEGMSPWEIAVARAYTDATQGYNPNTSSLQNSSMFEAIDKAYAASERSQRERLSKQGFDPDSGTYTRAMNKLDEQRNLGRQNAARDLYFQNENLKRSGAAQLAGYGQSVNNIPLAVSGAYGQQGAAAQNRADSINNQWGSLGGAIGMYQGMQGGGGGAPSIGNAQIGTPITPSTTMVPGASMATTSTMQPPNFGSMTANTYGTAYQTPFDVMGNMYGGNPQAKYKSPMDIWSYNSRLGRSGGK